MRPQNIHEKPRRIIALDHFTGHLCQIIDITLIAETQRVPCRRQLAHCRGFLPRVVRRGVIGAHNPPLGVPPCGQFVPLNGDIDRRRNVGCMAGLDHVTQQIWSFQTGMGLGDLCRVITPAVMTTRKQCHTIHATLFQGLDELLRVKLVANRADGLGGVKIQMYLAVPQLAKCIGHF